MVKTHEMHLSEPHFSQVKSGKKSVELRLKDDKRMLIKKGDNILFKSRADENEKVTVKVIGFYWDASFETLAEQFSIRKSGYCNVDSLVPDLEKFYPLDMQRKLGVMGIEFELV